MTDKKQLRADLVDWSQGRLHLWIKDTLMRYKAVDLPRSHAWGDVLASLLTMTASLLAVQSNIDADEAGQELAKAIRIMRRHHQAEKSL